MASPHVSDLLVRKQCRCCDCACRIRGPRSTSSVIGSEVPNQLRQHEPKDCPHDPGRLEIVHCGHSKVCCPLPQPYHGASSVARDRALSVGVKCRIRCNFVALSGGATCASLRCPPRADPPCFDAMESVAQATRHTDNAERVLPLDHVQCCCDVWVNPASRPCHAET